MICVLTGGTGGAKFVDGLRQVMPAEEITLIVNTGDDLLWWGLYVSPDIDSITYVLSGMLSRERGWGVKGDTFLCLQAMGQLGEPTWFHTGDRDLAVHLLRSRLLAEGKSSKEVAVALNISVKTAETHRANIMRKLELHSVSELVRYAVKNQIIEA